MIYPELVINSKNWEYLHNSWKRGRLPHAMLFHGPAGTGKEGHALELAALLNCIEVYNEESCGTCASCIKVKSLSEP